MMLSWALVEVPRYAFYVFALLTGDATKKTPFPLFWLRYSLFAVLYPTGIVGELTVFWNASYDEVANFAPLLALFYNRFLFVVYLFGSPGMIGNMVANRKSAFKKRFSKPRKVEGLAWPLDSNGQRSSTQTNKAILEAAVGSVSSEKAKAIDICNKWRFQYVKHLQGLVEEQCVSPESCLKIAETGLATAHERFEFVKPDGTVTSFAKAMSSKADKSFFTHTIKGEKPLQQTTLQIPYKGDVLQGTPLSSKISEWVEKGIIEPSCGAAMQECVDNPKWLANVSNRYFVLLGAGSAMGPLLVLLALGANVIAIDLDRPQIWQRLIRLAKDSPGTLTFPVKVDPKRLSEEELYAQAGCNLFTHTPMIRDWLLKVHPGKPLTVGCYAYLDGALHVQVSLAMDAICRDLSEQRKHTSLAYLCTPTDLHLIPEEAHQAAKDNYKLYSSKLYCQFARFLGKLADKGRWLRSNVVKPVPGQGGDYYLVNGISVAQGPNYALAKRLQHWRAVVARSKGCLVSSNIAPSTSTASVVHNRTFAWAYEGMPYFGFEILAPETSNAVMSALLVYDLESSKSWASPKKVLKNPNQLFSHGSFHGGLWRCPYMVDSIGEASVFLYFGRVARPYVATVIAIGAAGLAWYFSQ